MSFHKSQRITEVSRCGCGCCDEVGRKQAEVAPESTVCYEQVVALLLGHVSPLPAYCCIAARDSRSPWLQHMRVLHMAACLPSCLPHPIRHSAAKREPPDGLSFGPMANNLQTSRPWL